MPRKRNTTPPTPPCRKVASPPKRSLTRSALTGDALRGKRQRDASPNPPLKRQKLSQSRQQLSTLTSTHEELPITTQAALNSQQPGIQPLSLECATCKIEPEESTERNPVIQVAIPANHSNTYESEPVNNRPRSYGQASLVGIPGELRFQICSVGDGILVLCQ